MESFGTPVNYKKSEPEEEIRTAEVIVPIPPAQNKVSFVNLEDVFCSNDPLEVHENSSIEACKDLCGVSKECMFYKFDDKSKKCTTYDVCEKPPPTPEEEPHQQSASKDVFVPKYEKDSNYFYDVISFMTNMLRF